MFVHVVSKLFGSGCLRFIIYLGEFRLHSFSVLTKEIPQNLFSKVFRLVAG